MWREPHCATEDFRGVGGVAGDVEEAVGDAPFAAERQRDAVAFEGDFRAVRVDPEVVGVRGEGELDGGYCAGDVGLGHAGDLDGHFRVEVFGSFD